MAAGSYSTSAGIVMPQGRLEYKFLVPIEQIEGLRRALLPYVRLDAFCEQKPNKEYTVRSVYYDNRRFDCYYEKFDGFQFKKKLRIRGYDEEAADNTVFFEIKFKNGDFIGKHRAGVKWTELDRVFRNPNLDLNLSLQALDALKRFLFHYHRKRMVPVVLVAYEREAFFSRFDPRLRLTFDKNVRSRLYPQLKELYLDRAMKFVMPSQFVFEIKFYGTLPRWLQRVMTQFDLERLAVSKYALGIEAYPEEKKFLLGIGHTVEALPAVRLSK
ncbi:MAG: polyphosphate polymerase domain-containing protein [candidate division WOR-3 bacterium]